MFNYIYGRGIADVVRMVAVRSQMETNGRFDGDKEIDVASFNYRYLGLPKRYVTAKYRLEDLIKWGQYGFEYEEQLDKLDEQIAAEMAKQAKPEEETGSSYGKPQGTDASNKADDSTAELTEMSTRLEGTRTVYQAQARREGERNVCESEKELGSAAAERKLEKIDRMESLTGQVMPFLKRMF